MNRFELMKMHTENVRSSFSATSIVFGSVIGFLIATGLQARTLSVQDTALLAVWLFSFAGMAHNLLKVAENIVWHVPLSSNVIVLVCILVVASLIGFCQNIVPIDHKLWLALIPSWVISVLFAALIERPSAKELSAND